MPACMILFHKMIFIFFFLALQRPYNTNQTLNFAYNPA